MRAAFLTAFLLQFCVTAQATGAEGSPIAIVAVGSSGFDDPRVSPDEQFTVYLESMLKAKGLNVVVRS